jgi:hypothetical protein
LEEGGEEEGSVNPHTKLETRRLVTKREKIVEGDLRWDIIKSLTIN